MTGSSNRSSMVAIVGTVDSFIACSVLGLIEFESRNNELNGKID